MSANYINHIALVLDASGSMRHLEADVIRVADSQIASLAQQSKSMDQETRVTVYAFDGRKKLEPFFYDKDVLRLPSIKGLYKATGPTTPLIDATCQAIDELKQTAQLYGDHAFLLYVLTDGGDNDSKERPASLANRAALLPDNWTLATFVPGERERQAAWNCGFPKDNVAVWFTTQGGLQAVASQIDKATDVFMSGRARGIRGYRNLFNMDVANVSVKAAHAQLTPLHFGQYRMLQAVTDTPIAELIEAKMRRPYRLGEAYYQLMTPVKVQPQKQVVLHDRKSAKVFAGAGARAMLGLPDHEVRVAPASHPDLDIFIQSTSVNRKVLAGQKVLVMSA